MSGLLISFEGLDGTGKTTQLCLAEHWLRERGLEVAGYREPGGSRLSEAIRALLLDPAHTALAGETELLLYTAARVQLLVERVLPDLAAGRVVLLDRFADSTTAYQGYGRQLPMEWVTALNAQVRRLAWPARTFWLDLPAARALGRCTGQDRLEQSGADFFARVAEGYRLVQAAEPDRVMRVDATGTPGEVFARIEPELSRLLAGRKELP